MNARPSSRVNGNPPRNIFLVDGVWQFNLSRTRIIISVLTASTASPNRVWSSSSSSSYTRLLGGLGVEKVITWRGRFIERPFTNCQYDH